MVPVHGSCILKLSGTGPVCGPSKKGNRTETRPDFKALCACRYNKYIVTFGMTKSLGTISQWWGQAGCNRTTEGVCIWLIPKWAFWPQQPRPPQILLFSDYRTQKIAGFSKQNMRPFNKQNWILLWKSSSILWHRTHQVHLCLGVTNFFFWLALHIGCSHVFLWNLFRPKTDLTTYSLLDKTGPSTIGMSSHDILDYTNTRFYQVICSDLLRRAPKHSDVLLLILFI